jgi:hypothetical protein
MDDALHTMNTHLDEYSIEQVAKGRLGSEAIITHLMNCDYCSDRVAEVHMLRHALARLQPEPPVLVFEHQTTDGLIIGSYHAVFGRYIGRVVGPELDCGTFVESAAAARQWCERSFTEMFPDHTCGPICRPRPGER